MMSLTLLTSLVIATSAPAVDSFPLPRSLNDVEEAEFKKAPIAIDSTNRKVKKMMEASGCKVHQITKTWKGTKVNVLLLVSGEGKVKKIQPLNSGCVEVENFTAQKVANAAKQLKSKPSDGQMTWYKSEMIYIW